MGGGAWLRDGAPEGLSVRGVGGGHRPLISRQPEWPEPAAVPMERVAAHKRPDAFLGWRKGLCYLAREPGVPALGTPTAQPPDKTRPTAPSRWLAEPLGKARRVPRTRPWGSQDPLPTPTADGTLPPGPRHDLARALPPNRTQWGQEAPRP